MNIVFVANAMTPHQSPLCDSIAAMDGVNVTFIETKNVNRDKLPIGWRSSSLADYVVTFAEYNRDKDKYTNLILQADAVIMGGDYTHIVIPRLEAGKLTFVYSERIYRKTKDLLKTPYHYFKFRNKYKKYPNLHLLCASAFACADYKKIGCFKNKAYKWGYFINVPSIDVNQLAESKSRTNSTRIIWIARMIPWKHPEMPVWLAQELKKRNIDFEINMYGVGPEIDRVRDLINSTNTQDNVHLRGELSNVELMEQLQMHDIFVFTSDRNEGWGAVANEAMANGCALVGSSAIGSIPFLVENNVNGMIYEDGNFDSFKNCILSLIENPQTRKEISIKAYETLSNVWSPRNAAINLVQLINSLNNNQPCDISVGPCSRAEVLSNKWFKHRK